MKDIKADHKEIAKGLIEKRRKFNAEAYVELATAVAGAGGEMIHASFDDDDWCGTGRLPWPPKNIDRIIEVIGKIGGGGRIIINGIVDPTEINVIIGPDRIR